MSANPLSSNSCKSVPPCDIFFHIPKTAGQTLTNLILREYRDGEVIDTHGGMLTPAGWQRFTDELAAQVRQGKCHYRGITGHMKFGVHQLLPGPSRYITFLRDPVKRFASYYYMMRRMGIVPREHQIDLGRADWNLSAYETLPRELDNGQTRCLADAPWDLPIGGCTEEHLQAAQANVAKYFACVGLTEHFDLSLTLLRRICGWNWHFYVPRNVAPSEAPQDRLSHDVLQAISDLNQFDRRLYAYVSHRFWQAIREGGLGLRMEHNAYVMCNAFHHGIHHLVQPIKKRIRKSKRQPAADSVPIE